jgi:TolB protein
MQKLHIYQMKMGLSLFIDPAMGYFISLLNTKERNFIRVLTEAKMDESPSVAPNGNMVIYGIKEKDLSMLAGFSLSGAKFKLPASDGEVREPAWSNFLR